MPDEAPVTSAILPSMMSSLLREVCRALASRWQYGYTAIERKGMNVDFFLPELGEVPMRYAPEHNDETRERILAAASRLFREHGIAAVGLAKIMAEAELTVGTFYTHFKSKEALL